MSHPPAKRILIVSQHFWPETFRINDICEYFLERDCQVDVLCGIPNYPKGIFFKGYSFFKKRNENYKQAQVYRAFEIPRGPNTNFRIFINYVSFPLGSLLYLPKLLGKKYDKILLYQTSPVMMSICGILLGRIKKIETSMYVLDLWPENLFSVIKPKSTLLRRMATSVSHWHYRHVDKLLALSNKMKDQLESITNLPNEKIIVVPQACEKLYEEEVHDPALAKRFGKGFNVFFAGNISPAQSFDTVVAAAKTLKKAGLTDINWIIVGDGMSRKWLGEEVGIAGLSQNFYFEGMKPVADIPRYTGVADVLLGCLVKSNLLEATIPAKVSSYLAAGKPMVLAMDGEARELVNNQAKCGYAGPTEDAKALASNIKKIYNLTPKERLAMGNRGRDYHFKHFERNLVLNNLYDFLFDNKPTEP